VTNLLDQGRDREADLLDFVLSRVHCPDGLGGLIARG
jgi:hypothetical protein